MRDPFSQKGRRRGYFYGFNGKEKIDEQYGIEGTAYDFGARLYDSRTAKFLSTDPLTDNFPMLTPYQYASNNPIGNIDLDGLEGVSYRVVKKDETTGETTAIKRVIESTIYIATNEKGKDGGYKPKSAEALKVLLTTKYNEKGYLDDEGLPVEFKFNYIDFNPSITAPSDLALQLANSRTTTLDFATTYDVNGTLQTVSYESYTSVVLWKEKIPGDGKHAINTLRIDPDRGMYDFGHAESHELSHFFLMTTGFIDRVPETIDDHSLGGWMQYGKQTINEKTGEIMKTEGVDFNFSKDTFDHIIKSVPRINDKEE